MSLSTEKKSQPPLVTEHPESQNPVYGKSLTLSVRASGSDTLLYQWTKDGVPITDELGDVNHYNTPNLQIHHFSLKHDGNYKCIVTNNAGTAESGSADIKGIINILQ